MPDLTQYDSSRFPLITDSIDHSKDNKLVLGNMTLKVMVDGVLVDDMNILKPYEEFIEENVVEVSVPDEVRYRPEAVAKEFYGTNDLWWLVMWSGGYMSKLDFLPVNGVVKIFDPDKIYVLNSIIEKRKGDVDDSRTDPVVCEDITITKIVL